MIGHGGVDTIEIETGAAVLCAHDGRECATDTEVVCDLAHFPVRGCKAPCFDMLRLGPGLPDLRDRLCHDCTDGDI